MSPRTGSDPAELAEAVLVALHAAGVRHLAFCPGARSAPLVFAADRLGGFTTSVHLDERGGAFWALGHARISARPVGVVCTSGSALANLMPAVVEARACGIPLVLLTGDRPAELLDCGAPQTLDQRGLFGGQVRDFLQLDAELLGAGAGRAGVERRVLRALARASAPEPGPVHLNLAFREPLGEEGGDDGGGRAAPFGPNVARGDAVAAHDPAVALEPSLVEALAACRAPLLVAGPEVGLRARPSAALLALAAALGAPVLADALSGFRTRAFRARAHEAGVPLLGSYATWIDEVRERRAFRPDVVIRVGAIPPARSFEAWTRAIREIPHVFVDPSLEWRDPVGVRGWYVRASVDAFARSAVGAVAGVRRGARSRQEPGRLDAVRRWCRGWEAAEAAARDWIEAGIGVPEEGRVARTLAAELGERDLLHVASSMPIRDLDAWVPTLTAGLTTANRGTNGIDGTVSTALGQAAAWRADGGGRTWVLVGDVAALHDLNALAVHEASGDDVTIVIVNNDGGGIFGFLPFARTTPLQDRFFRTRHGHRFEGLARLVGAPWRRTTPDALADTLAWSRAVEGPALVEVVTDGLAHRDAWRRARAELADLARGVADAIPPSLDHVLAHEAELAGRRTHVVERAHAGAHVAVAALHGFTGRASDLLPLFASLPGIPFVAWDLPGHGHSAPSEEDPCGQVGPELRQALARAGSLAAHPARGGDSPRETVVRLGLGYSLGGRLLLMHAARGAPLDGLILIGAGVGIEDGGVRDARYEVDRERAEQLRSQGTDAFLDAWRRLPLLVPPALRPAWVGAWIDAPRREHDAEELARMLLSASTGRMPWLGAPDAPGAEIPSLWIVGQSDVTYRPLAKEMARTRPLADLAIIEGAGHAAHLDRPEAVAQAIRSWIDARWGATEARDTEARDDAERATEARATERSTHDD